MDEDSEAMRPPGHRQTVTEWIRDSILYRTGVTRVTLEEMQEHARARWNEDLERRCFNRLVVGAVRYEVNGDAPYDKIGSARRRLEAYEKTGNLECLADALNLIKIEMCSPKQGAHWKSSDDGDEHCGWRE